MHIILFLLLALVSAASTIYLVYKRKKAEVPVCPLKGDCSFVLNSKYNKIFGIHTDMIGLAYYAGLGLWILGVIIFTTLPTFGIYPFMATSGDITTGTMIFMLSFLLAPVVATYLAFLMTLRMLYIQFVIIKKMCFWCLLSSACIIGMTLIISILLFVVLSA